MDNVKVFYGRFRVVSGNLAGLNSAVVVVYGLKEFIEDLRGLLSDCRLSRRAYSCIASELIPVFAWPLVTPIVDAIVDRCGVLSDDNLDFELLVPTENLNDLIRRMNARAARRSTSISPTREPLSLDDFRSFVERYFPANSSVC